MTIREDIIIFKSWLDIFEAMNRQTEVHAETKQFTDSMRRVANYAEKCHKKEYAELWQEEFTKIMKGENNGQNNKKAH